MSSLYYVIKPTLSVSSQQVSVCLSGNGWTKFYHMNHPPHWQPTTSTWRHQGAVKGPQKTHVAPPKVTHETFELEQPTNNQPEPKYMFTEPDNLWSQTTEDNSTQMTWAKTHSGPKPSMLAHLFEFLTTDLGEYGYKGPHQKCHRHFPTFPNFSWHFQPFLTHGEFQEPCWLVI